MSPDDLSPSEDLVDPTVHLDEGTIDAALRPKHLAEFVGQTRVREQLGLVLSAASGRGAAPDHVLLSGPPGLGKTTLAMIIAAEVNQPLRISSGPAIQHAGDLAAVLSSLIEGEVLFFDEIHRMARPAEEMLYLAMEDFRVDVVVGKGPGATAIPLDIPPFTLVGATTRAGLLPGPLRDRFGFTAHLDFYDPDELTAILVRSAELLDVRLEPDGATEIAGRSRGTPRVANRLLRRVRDFAEVRGSGVVDRRHGPRRPDHLRRRRARSRPPRPLGDGGPGAQVRWRPGRVEHACRGGGRRTRDGRGGRRAVPGQGRAVGPYATRADRHPSGVGASGSAAAGARAGASLPLRPHRPHRWTAPTRLTADRDKGA